MYQFHVAVFLELARDEWPHFGMFLPCIQGRTSCKSQPQVRAPWFAQSCFSCLVVKYIIYKL